MSGPRKKRLLTSEVPLHILNVKDTRAIHHTRAIYRGPKHYTSTSLMCNRRRPGPYSRTMPRTIWGSLGAGRFLMSEVPL